MNEDELEQTLEKIVENQEEIQERLRGEGLELPYSPQWLLDDIRGV